MVDALVVFVQTDGLDDDVVHAQRDQLAVQPVAEGAGFVAAVSFVGQGHLAFYPREEFGRGELLRGLRGAGVQDADHHDGVGVDVQAQFEGGEFLARGLIRANAGGMEVWLGHSV